MKVKKLSAFISVAIQLVAGSLLATTDASYYGVKYSTKGDIVPGEWTCQFDKAKAYSEANDIPLVVFWGNKGCPHCVVTEESMASKTFTDWQQGRGLIMVFTVGSVTPGNNSALAYAFCRNNSTSIPRMAVYWKGHVLADGTKERARLNMPDKTAKQVIDTIEKYVKGYVASTNSDFGFEESECNRYEAEAATTNVTVELVRKTSSSALKESLKVIAPDGKTAIETVSVDWAAGESNKLVAVGIPAGTFAHAGERLTLQVLNKGGEPQATAHVTYVEKGNSAANPDWVGEELAFGRWTADVDGAEKFAADNGGYTLVSVQGSLWCPDCANTDRNFLDVEEGGVNLFKAWAAANKVMLVTLDIPNYTGPDVADRATPTLFSKDAYATALARAKEYPQSGADASLTNKIVRSGLGYLSRKGISDADAGKTLGKFHDLAYLNTDKGGFHRPEDGNRNRTGVPIFVLLKGDRVVARFTRFAAASPMAADRANFGAYVRRFEEMMTLAEEDETEIANNWPCEEDGLAMLANGGELASTLCNADFQDAVKLVGLTGAGVQRIEISGPGDAGVTVQLYRLAADGTVTAVGASHICEHLSEGASFAEVVSGAGTYFALVKGRDITSDAFAAESAAADHFVAYTLSGSTVYVPGEGRANGVADGEGSAVVRLVRGELYRLEGLDNLACADELEAVDEEIPHKYFRALVEGDAPLAVSGGAGRAFSYQLWRPGEVGFAETSKTVPESVNDKDNDWVSVPLSRTGGASGAVKVRVSVDADATDLGDSRYELLDAAAGTAYADYVWEDGVSTNLAFRVRVLDDIAYDGDADLVLKVEVLASESGGAAVAEGRGTYVLTVTEDDKATPGRAMVTRADPYWAKAKTVYARAGEGAKVWAARIEASDGLAGVEVKSSLAGVGFATEDPRDLEEVYNEKTRKTQTVLWWSSREMDEKYLWVTNVPAGKSAKVTLNNYGNFKVVSASNAVTVVSVADDAPYYEKDDVSATVYRYVAHSASYAVKATQGGKLTFAKLSGALPAGLSVAYDAEAAAMVVSGTPTTSDAKTGVKRYEAVYQVTEARPAGAKTAKVPGLTIRLVYDVVDPALAGGGESGLEPLNSFFTTSRTYADIPVVDRESGTLAGTLQVTIPRTGKASAKLVCALGTISFAASSWSELYPDSGAMVVTLASKDKTYKKAMLRVSALPTGDIAVLLTGENLAYDATARGVFWSKAAPAEAYKGSYVLTMPTNAINETVSGLAPSGAPYLTLKMTSATQWNAGKVTWAGVLANGTAISGTSILTEEQLSGGKVAYLPIVRYSTTDFFSALPRIATDNTVSCAVLAGDSTPVTVRPFWAHQEVAKALQDVSWEVSYDLGGGLYEKPDDGSYDIEINGLPMISDKYGDILPISTLPQMVVTNGKVRLTEDNPNKFTVSLAATGIVGGSFKLYYNDGKKYLPATYKGVFVRNAEGESVLSGAWNFTDKYLNANIKRGGVVIAK